MYKTNYKELEGIAAELHWTYFCILLGWECVIVAKSDTDKIATPLEKGLACAVDKLLKPCKVCNWDFLRYTEISALSLI